MTFCGSSIKPSEPLHPEKSFSNFENVVRIEIFGCLGPHFRRRFCDSIFAEHSIFASFNLTEVSIVQKTADNSRGVVRNITRCGSAAPSLSLAVDLVYLGTQHRLFDFVLPDSVQPGFVYTVRYSIVPNDVLAGNAVLLRAIIYHTDNRILEVCSQTEADILNLP
ncbi:hypothetical protein Fcan01_27634 [Folsomia candida]|uniref:Uncharacterized protein n=1 Tax=Folsomia candida TaxID=158441 RepID=A0A226CXQ4_FOLCA|nr:hypothetical protein Fcan01_27634 [Folsomia candida]